MKKKTNFNKILTHFYVETLGYSKTGHSGTTNSLFDFIPTDSEEKKPYLQHYENNTSFGISEILVTMISPPESLKLPINIPQMRLLMGPGPSNVSERVLKAQSLPTLGHLHPEFCKVTVLFS